MSREAKVLITSENKSQAGIKAATNDVLGFGEATKKVGDTIQNAFKVLTIAKFAQEVGKFAFDSVKAFGEVERKMTQLKVAVGGSDESFGRLNNHIQKLSSLTLASKGEVQDLVARLAALGKSDADIERISSAAIHLSNVTGQGLNEAMKQVNATFSGSVDEMGKLIPELRGLTKEQLAAGDAVDILNTKFGNLSEEMATGVSQSLKNLSDNYGDLRENIGQELQGLFTPMITGINAIIEGWNKAYEARKRAASAGDEELARLIREEAKAEAAFDRAKGLLATARGEAGKKRVSAEEAKWYQDKLQEAEAAYQLAMRAFSQAGMTRQAYENKVNPTSSPIGGVNAPGASGGSGGSSGQSVWQTPGGQALLAEMNEALYGAGAAAAAVISSGSWNPGAFYDSYSVTKTDFGQTKEEVPSIFEKLATVLGPVVDQFGGMLSSLGSVKAIMDPIGLILEGFMEVLGPLIDEALAPLVGVFKILGQLLAKTLVPVINILSPVIEGIAKIFIWFANKVMIPVGNFIIDIWNGIAYGINMALRWLGVNIRYASRLSEVGLADAQAAGTSPSSGGSGGGGGAGATYTGSRPITFNFYNQGNVVGSGGMEELAALIESIIRRNERYA